MLWKRKDLEEDGFGSEKFFSCFVAEWHGNSVEGEDSAIVGYALYFFTYSTWEGRCIYMEDIYVKQKFRGSGIGTHLLKAVAQEGIRKRCCRLEFAVLDWNKPSIDFYISKGAINLTASEGWNKFRINETGMLHLCQDNWSFIFSYKN